MAEGLNELEGINWRRCFSFLEILRSFRMALHPAKLFLCLVGLAVSVGAAALVDLLPQDLGSTSVGGLSFWQNFVNVLKGPVWGHWPTSFDSLTSDAIIGLALAPVAAAARLIGLAVDYWREAPLFALLNTILSLAVWAVVGGAVTRMAAVRFAREESVPLKKALCFSLRKWPSLVTSPLIPLGVLVLFVGVVAACTGLPANIPYVGEVLLGLLWWLPQAAFFLGALILVAALFSLGLQWPTIAAEGSDSFDAISRSVSYISSRPWRYLFYTGFATVYGGVTFIFVKLVAYLTLAIGHFSVGLFTFKGDALVSKLDRIWAAPSLANPWPSFSHTDAMFMKGAEPFANIMLTIWIGILLGLMVSFLISFFFTSQTVIYFLLRRIVDATDVEEVYVEEAEEEGLPLEHKIEGPEPVPPEPAAAKPESAKPEGEAGAPPPASGKK